MKALVWIVAIGIVIWYALKKFTVPMNAAQAQVPAAANSLLVSPGSPSADTLSLYKVVQTPTNAPSPSMDHVITAQTLRIPSVIRGYYSPAAISKPTSTVYGAVPYRAYA